MENEEDVKLIFYLLCESVAERLRESGFQAGQVQIGLRDNALCTIERQIRLQTPSCLCAELHEAAMALLRQHYRWQRPLRSVGVQAGELRAADGPAQLSMFRDDTLRRARKEKLESTVDDIRRRFGRQAICRAAVMTDATLAAPDVMAHRPAGCFSVLRG